jgi:hypothetical protein
VDLHVRCPLTARLLDIVWRNVPSASVNLPAIVSSVFSLGDTGAAW